MDTNNHISVIISPLNSIYWFDSTYHESHLDLIKIINKDKKDSEAEINTENLSDDCSIVEKFNSIIQYVPYVKKEFLDKMKENSIRLKLYYKKKEEIPIIKFLFKILDLHEYFNFNEDVISLDEVTSYNKEKQIILSESVDDLLKFDHSVHQTILNNLLFKQSNEYLKLQEKNFSILKQYENSFQPDLIIESLRQSNGLILFLNNNRNSSPKEYFKSALKVLYMFDSKSASKNYRKREVTISTHKIHFTPIINRNFHIEDEFLSYNIKPDFHVFLQRCPYFYLDKLENHLNNHKNIVLMHDFKYIDAFFNRLNVYKFLFNFVNKIKQKFTYKYGINIEVPYSIDFSIEDDIKYSNQESKKEIDLESTLTMIKDHIENIIQDNSANLNYPFIIKPDSCTDHKMYLILSPEGIKNFANSSNFSKILKMKNFIIQKFIPHGGLMFKNYYINRKSFTIVRPSIPNLEGKIMESKRFENKCFSFHNEFLYAKEDPTLWEDAKEGSVVKESDINMEALDGISKSFVKVTGVSLFGLDYLYDKDKNTYYLLEVNYFPSYRELGTKLSDEFAEHIIDYYNTADK